QSASRHKARGQAATSFALVWESPLANSVTSCPSRTSSSVRYETTRSVPPYRLGGTLSYRAATCAILMMDLTVGAGPVSRWRVGVVGIGPRKMSLVRQRQRMLCDFHPDAIDPTAL